ncbi:MAG: pantoate--beta-alanine ligase [Bacteroidetes bacterium]|nr:pantoate--beta-alanine ligase [Bacteroidota bacterium]
MELIRTIAEAHDLVEKIRLSGRLIGLVPTMGALHRGHLLLVDEIRDHVDVIIMSIFVNPLQFGPNEDFDRYPRTLDSDVELAETVGVDYIFCPDVSEMYAGNVKTRVVVADLPNHLCGLSRPGHFDGVTTVVTKLINILKPHIAIFGQKDMQQAIIIQKMVKDLSLDVKIMTLPTVREVDGLAMSSRNNFLSEADRHEAVKLFQSLNFAKQMIVTGERDLFLIVEGIKNFITTGNSAEIDYIGLVDTETLEDLTELKDGSSVLIALAVKFGKTRLIDNLTIKIPVFEHVV